MSELRIEEKLLKVLMTNRLTISTAESCTGGLIAKRITDIPGSSSVFLGGCVTYTAELKEKLLNVSPETIKRDTVVSASCAEEMAIGARRLMHSDFAVSTTGYAGPGGGTTDNPVGTVFIGIATPYRSFAFRFSDDSNASRDEVRQHAASKALLRVYREITGEDC